GKRSMSMVVWQDIKKVCRSSSSIEAAYDRQELQFTVTLKNKKSTDGGNKWRFPLVKQIRIQTPETNNAKTCQKEWRKHHYSNYTFLGG
ncbi:MAG TPA: hypothetical protein VFX22_11640, partial [Candidatus Kapabacteria bacterium]|nr:hypothetical protein [Candidatus Kapabacteria bacterium]